MLGDIIAAARVSVVDGASETLYRSAFDLVRTQNRFALFPELR